MPLSSPYCPTTNTAWSTLGQWSLLIKNRCIHGVIKCTALMAVERSWSGCKTGMRKYIGKLLSNWNLRYIFIWKMAFCLAQPPRYNTDRASLLSWKKRCRGRTASSDLSTPFALTYKLLWEISDPNIATIKSRLNFENKQEYHTRWYTCKLQALYFWSILSATHNQAVQLHFTG